MPDARDQVADPVPGPRPGGAGQVIRYGRTANGGGYTGTINGADTKGWGGNDQSGATWTLQNNSSIGGNGTFNNLGTLQGTGNATISTALTNGGTLGVQSGTLGASARGKAPTSHVHRHEEQSNCA